MEGHDAAVIAVRLARKEDGPTLGRLLADFNAEFETASPSAAALASGFERVIGDNAFAVLAFDGAALGFAFVTLRPTPYFDGPICQLEELYVVPGMRGRGIGTALLSELVAEARRRGSEEMHINVDEIDVDARRFYERHGFVNVEPGRDYRMLCYIQLLGP